VSDDSDPTCIICGRPIRESAGEVPVYLGNEFPDLGDHDGSAYHLRKCEDDVFETTFAEVEA